MIIPTNIVPVHKSIIYKALILLNRKNTSYQSNTDIFENILEYFNTMTVLFALGYVDKEGEISNDISNHN